MAESGKVLVVEDDDGIRRLIREVLGARGYEVHEVADGLSALGAALAYRPDVVLLDIGLPGLDGFGVLEQLKDYAELARIPVLMVTAWAEPELVTKALDRGAHDYIRKPFDISELAARVDAAARLKTRHDALDDDNQRLTAMATCDPVTGLANRRGLSEHLEHEIAAARRSRRELSVVMVDLDSFKAVNDTYGHVIGDTLLTAISRRMAVRVRSTDAVGRWGGDEFVIVLPDTDLEGARVLAEDLRAAIADRPVDTPMAAVRMSVSIGVAQWAGESVEGLLDRCDNALYEAKAAGRNAVAVAPAAIQLVA